ncbi:gliding motility-associated C-terminal domain-containing protein [Flavobacterium rhizosphaerae]|uniref:Gliding motility-associated C-terminal domain-containing protein n=1 Tax=Flavobacterium rhizosphaerae TaxID=3163298 RepID=A0ABW8YYH3_9FLAO
MYPTKPIRALYILLCLTFTSLCFSQLPNFTLTVTPTAQTCLGNGSLAFTVTGINPSATMAYQVYLLPDTTTAVTTVNASYVGGLTAGNYLVVATQTLGGLSNTATASATIANNVVPLTYTLQGQNVRCGNDGKITVNVTSGNAVSYEIMEGPVTLPPQPSNVLNNLPVGTYQVRVYDDCGEAVVVTLQLVQLATNITILTGTALTGELPECNHIIVRNDFYCPSALEIFFPVTLQYTVYPPGGGTPVGLSQTIANGADYNTATQAIPFYPGEAYTYSLQITDVCGNTFTKPTNNVDAEFNVINTISVENCDDFIFTLELYTFKGPVTVDFTAAPEGFNPVDYNEEHPDFDTALITYGQSGNYVPEGNYSVTITDACGSVAVYDFEVTPPEVNPQVVTQLQNCAPTGTINIMIPGREIVAISITEAPNDYTGTLPQDVSAFLDDEGVFIMPGLPIGDYLFTLTDSCGEEHDVPAALYAAGQQLTVQQRPGCQEGYGSIALSSSGTGIVSISITEAPEGFTADLPLDVSSNISGNNFYMNTLPEGLYTFNVVDLCGGMVQQDIIVQGYHITANDVDLTPHCGSFDLYLHNTSNGFLNTYWLQVYDEEAGVWVHPATGLPYTEGVQPNNNTALQLLNNTNNINLAFTGDFRIIKVNFTYANGMPGSELCVNVVEEFSFDGGPVITDAYSFPCSSGLTEVAVIAEGVPPLMYMITQKNGDPFVIDNGESNLFSGLEPATYNFRVTDDCGNIRNIQFDINELDPLEIEATGFCEGEESVLSILNFDFLTYEWFKEGAAGTVISNTSSLTFPAFDSDTDAGTYYVNILSDDPTSCLNQTLEYTVAPNELPFAGNDATVALCNAGEDINLEAYLTTGYDTGGAWTDIDNTGALNNNLFATQGIAQGSYSFKYSLNDACGLTDEAVVTIQLKDIPDAPVVATPAPVCEGEAVQLSVANVPGATYLWTGPAGFSTTEQNPVLSAVSPNMSGAYTVTTTVNGCASDAVVANVVINALPDFSIAGNTLLCQGQSVVLSVEGINFNNNVNYTWYQNGDLLNITTGAIEVFETGTYQVTVDNNGCTASREVTVSQNTNAFTVVPDGGCVDEEYMLWIDNLTEISGVLFEWTGPGGYSYLGEQANISGQMPGEYTVAVTNADGCTETGSINVESTWCKIPRGISPNGDSMNDNFDLSNLDIREIKIFNRYGLEVYHEKNYKNQWYGQSDKGDLPTATYFYILTMGSGKKVTGWVYLLKQL